MSKLWVVARFELLSNLRRWEFLVLTVGMPIMSALLLGMSSVPNAIHLVNEYNNPRIIAVGFVDQTHHLSFPSRVPFDDTLPLPMSVPVATHGGGAFTFQGYPTVEAARADLMAARIEFVYAIPADYLQTGKVSVYHVSRGVFHGLRTPPVRRILEENLLHGRVDDATLRRAEEPMRSEEVLLSPTGFVIADPLQQEMGQLLLPCGMMLLMLMSVMSSSTYLLRGLSEEKENRIMEILLASVSPASLFYGKILGLGLLGLIQVLFWMLLTVPFLSILLSFLHLSALTALLFVVYFALGYALYAGLIAGVGAVGSTEKESNQILSLFAILAVTPMMLMPIILDDANGVLARAFSFIPFTAPTVMMLRMVQETPPLKDLLLSLLSMIVSIFVVLRLSLKVFRMGLLMYGKTPGFRELLRWLRQA